jgi:hypothetical protein
MRDREKGTAVDYAGHFEREAAAFEAAVHRWDAENAVGTPGPSTRRSLSTRSGRLSRSWRP